jgi:hypothetical protein
VLSERRQLPLADLYITSSLSTGPRIPKATTGGWGHGSETSEGTARTPALLVQDDYCSCADEPTSGPHMTVGVQRQSTRTAFQQRGELVMFALSFL